MNDRPTDEEITELHLLCQAANSGADYEVTRLGYAAREWLPRLLVLVTPAPLPEGMDTTAEERERWSRHDPDPVHGGWLGRLTRDLDRAIALIAELEAEIKLSKRVFGVAVIRHTNKDPDDLWNALMDEIRARPAP